MVGNGSPARKRVRMDYDERRASILRAARKLFRRRAYSEVSVRDIAEEAGVATGLLHHYFGSKRGLYLEVLRSVATIPRVPIPADADGLADAEIWARSVDGLIAIIEDQAERWIDSVSLAPAAADREIAAILDDGREVLAEQTLLALGVDDPTDQATALVRGYGGLVQEVLLEWLDRGRLTKAEVREILLRTMPLLLSDVLPHVEAHVVDDRGG